MLIMLYWLPAKQLKTFVIKLGHKMWFKHILENRDIYVGSQTLATHYCLLVWCHSNFAQVKDRIGLRYVTMTKVHFSQKIIFTEYGNIPVQRVFFTSYAIVQGDQFEWQS